jgi:SAM-dependent methyltransferase
MDVDEIGRVVREGYDAIAASYLSRRRGKDSRDLALLGEIVGRLPRGASVLDAGCGAGIPIAKFLSTSFRVTGLDFSEAQVRLAQEHVPEARFVRGNIRGLGFSDGRFDAVVSYYAIIHIPRQAHAGVFQEIYRVLRPGGLALLCLGADDLAEDTAEDYLGTRMYWSHYDADTNISMLKECGFTIVLRRIVPDCFSPGSEHLFVLARR